MSSAGKSPFDVGTGSDLAPAVRAFRTLLLVGQRLRYLMDERLRADGLTTQQAALLTAVEAMDRPTLGQAADALGTTHQNAAQLVAALERKGLLTGEPDPSDRRRRRLVTTEGNAAYWRDRNPGDYEAVAGWFATLSGTELDTLCELTARVAESLKHP
jgi:DNA-binding MarR family transcriptional regulator